MVVYIWGTGQKSKCVFDSLFLDRCTVGGFIDNNPEKKNTLYMGYDVCMYSNELSFEYIIISIVKYEAVIFQLDKLNVPHEKIIIYFDRDCEQCFEQYNFIDSKLWKINYLENELENTKRILGRRLDNYVYEINNDILNACVPQPVIGDTDKAIEQIVAHGNSLIRFGDGEFNIISGVGHPIFQDGNAELGEKMKEIIGCDDEKMLVGIADNYGNLNKYTDEIADGIRAYMTDEIRKIHYSILKPQKTYYDAYMFKCYYPYKDKEGTQKRVDLVKKIWDNRDVVLVEGNLTRSGVGNDLFDNVKSLRRILGPIKNAYSKYNELLEAIKTTSKDKLILFTLGPAGKVLAYELFKQGYQVVDIGQIDMDYDWYLAGAKFKISNSKKYISQLPPAEVEQLDDDEYKKQVIIDLS